MSNVFVSHRGNDTREAEHLAEELRDAGHRVWIDKWKIDLGDSIVERINEGLEGATYLVLCYSSSGVQTPWMGREWMSTLARQLNGEGVQILPIMLTGGKPPAILADVKYADLTQEWSAGVDELLKAIK